MNLIVEAVIKVNLKVMLTLKAKGVIIQTDRLKAMVAITTGIDTIIDTMITEIAIIVQTKVNSIIVMANTIGTMVDTMTNTIGTTDMEITTIMATIRANPILGPGVRVKLPTAPDSNQTAGTVVTVGPIVSADATVDTMDTVDSTTLRPTRVPFKKDPMAKTIRMMTLKSRIISSRVLKIKMNYTAITDMREIMVIPTARVN